MRLIVDSLIALMLVAILATVLLHYRQHQRQLEQVRFVHRSLAQLHEQTVYHRAMAQVEDARSRHMRQINSSTGFPRHVAPGWFDERFPVNVLVSVNHPWIDVAPPGDRSDHPPDPVVEEPDQAGFWYNPHRGIFRARVPKQFSEERTLELYNQVNGTALLSLPYDDDPARAPQPHRPLSEPAEQAEQVHGAAQNGASIFQTSRLDEHLDTLTFTLPAMMSLDHNYSDSVRTDADIPAHPPAEADERDDESAAGDEQANAQMNRPTLLDRPRGRALHQ